MSFWGGAANKQDKKLLLATFTQQETEYWNKEL